jgi:hypothetical protein
MVFLPFHNIVKLAYTRLNFQLFWESNREPLTSAFKAISWLRRWGHRKRKFSASLPAKRPFVRKPFQARQLSKVRVGSGYVNAMLTTET